MKLSPLAAACALAAFALHGAATAAPLPIVGGITAVTLTSAPVLTGAGLTVGGVGSAVISPGSSGTPIAFFPVTGGSIDTATFAGSIQHNGSGLSLTSASASVSLTNFVIDTIGNVLTGSVTTGGSTQANVPIFNIGASGNVVSPFSLTLTSTAAGALSTVFGIPNLTGAQIGTANTIPVTAVPEPSTYAMLLGGLALMGVAMNRRRQQ